MKHRTREQLSNIPPEARKTIEDKLHEKGIEFKKVQLVKLGKRMGVFCPNLFETFVIKNYCKSCHRHLGGSGRYYYCLDKNKKV